MTLDEATKWADRFDGSLSHTTSTVALSVLAYEVRRLQAELEESDAVRNKCAQLLAETAVALKGEEKALHRHGWRDLPKVAAIMRAEVTALRLYAPARRAQPTVKTAPIAPTNWPAWGMIDETDEEFAAWGKEYTEVVRWQSENGVFPTVSSMSWAKSPAWTMDSTTTTRTDTRSGC